MFVEGNDKVIAALELLLTKAREGRAGFLIATLHTKGAPALGGFFGTLGLERTAMLELEQIAAMHEETRKQRKPPKADKRLGYDYVTYNLPVGPTGFDMITFLVDAEMTRTRHGAPAPLKVFFWQGATPEASNLNTDNRIGILEKVMRPSLALISAVETDKHGRVEQYFGMSRIVEAARRGEPVPRFKAPADAPREYFAQAPVTITLREAKHWPHRNSNIAAWLRFADDLKAAGEHVIFVRDTAKADLPLPGEFTYPEAATDLHARMALYEVAKCNLFVGNGPGSLAWFGDRPWLQFMALTDDEHPYKPLTRGWFKKFNGIAEGEQWPWSLPTQRIVWQADTYENLCAAWAALDLKALESDRLIAAE